MLYKEDWQIARINFIIDYYGKDFFKGKKLLELGAFFGETGNEFYKLGAKVDCIEGRIDNVNYGKSLFPKINFACRNLEEGLPEGKWDIIINMGLIYHLNDCEKLIKDCYSSCRHMVLETEVSDSFDPNYILKVDESVGSRERDDNNMPIGDQSVSGTGIRPSEFYVERILKENGFKFIKILNGALNAEYHRYDWKNTNDGQWSHGLRRFWICENENSDII